VLDVPSDRLRRDREPGGNLLVRRSPREQAQHLELPVGQAGRPVHGQVASTGPGGRQHGPDGVPVQAPAGHLVDERGPRLGGRARRPVCTRLDQRAPFIGRGQYPRHGGQQRRRRPPVVAGTVEALVVCPRDDGDVP
jgi:hypothetical protein